MTQTWYKWNYVCSSCDALIEVTALVDGYSIKSETCMKCLSSLTLLSVVDATISTIPTKKEEEMITETPAQTMTINWIKNDVETTETYTVNDVRSVIYNNKSLSELVNNNYLKEQKLRTLLNDVFHDSEDQETLEKIANIFDVPLTKEIDVSVLVRANLVIEVDMRDGEYDIESLVSENLTIDSYGSEINVSDFSIESVEENY